MKTSYRIIYQKISDKKARLLRIYGTSAKICIPETVGGYPIVEVAPYCFCETRKLKYEESLEEIIGEERFLQELCGNSIEEIYLPDSIEKIGNYAFYNCKKLKKIELGAKTKEIGSDAFMNTISLHQLTFRCSPNEKSGIKQILARFSSDIEVTFEGESGIEAVLLYPEYYESYDEIAPAHLFGRNIEGEGFRARQCIQDGRIDFVGYDRIFEQACVEESENTLAKMALNRLQYPYALKENARQMYSAYLKEHILALMKPLVEKRQLETLQFLCRENILEGARLTEAIELTACVEWAEGTAELLQFKAKQNQVSNRYDFDEF
ncbi:MAG: leucine-rich repeat domain-containing protein [Lachnospiraceae bacterium]|nr:leucine-rich repeat domain-containing protein [Lachnospiraceae bacterium]